MAAFDCLEIRLEPIGKVVSSRMETTDDFWDKEQCFVELFESFGDESLLGLSEFSHAEIIFYICLLYTSPSPRDGLLSRMPSSA